MSFKTIGITGFARTGKNLFGELIKRQLEAKGYHPQMYSIAAELKRDCSAFLRDHCGVDVYTQDTSVKTKIRPFLLWYAQFKRQQNGEVWTSEVEKDMRFDADEAFDAGLLDHPMDVAIVTDVRFMDAYTDEVKWIHSLNGKLIHLTTYYNIPLSGTNLQVHQKQYILPANIEEEWNDPHLQKNADVLVEWEYRNIPWGELLVDPTLTEIVKETLTKLGY